MKIKKVKIFSIFICTLLVILGFSIKSNATLTTIGTANYNFNNYNLIYDSDLGITWLDYSKSRDVWTNQLSWAWNLNNSGVLIYSVNPGVTVSWSGGWRLPESVDGPYPYTGTRFNDTTSEMGHLYYTELGNAAGGPMTNTGDFENLITDDEWSYWSTPESSVHEYSTWAFNFSNGALFLEMSASGGLPFYALAVRSSNVTFIPEPSTYLLLGSGIIGLAFWRRRRKLKG